MCKQTPSSLCIRGIGRNFFRGGGRLLDLKWEPGRQMCSVVILGSVCHSKKKFRGGGGEGGPVCPPGYATAVHAISLDCTCILAFRSVCVLLCDEFSNYTFIIFYCCELVLRLHCVCCFICSIMSIGSVVDENV